MGHRVHFEHIEYYLSALSKPASCTSQANYGDFPLNLNREVKARTGKVGSDRYSRTQDFSNIRF